MDKKTAFVFDVIVWKYEYTYVTTSTYKDVKVALLFERQMCGFSQALYCSLFDHIINDAVLVMNSKKNISSLWFKVSIFQICVKLNSRDEYSWFPIRN